MKRFFALFIIAAFVCAQVARAQVILPQNQNPAPDKKAEDCGCEVKIPDGVAGMVNGVKVTVEEIDAPVKDKIQELQEQLINSRKGELDLLINARLLDIEAKKRGIT